MRLSLLSEARVEGWGAHREHSCSDPGDKQWPRVRLGAEEVGFWMCFEGGARGSCRWVRYGGVGWTPSGEVGGTHSVPCGRGLGEDWNGGGPHGLGLSSGKRGAAVTSVASSSAGGEGVHRDSRGAGGCQGSPHGAVQRQVHAGGCRRQEALPGVTNLMGLGESVSSRLRGSPVLGRGQHRGPRSQSQFPNNRR